MPKNSKTKSDLEELIRWAETIVGGKVEHTNIATAGNARLTVILQFGNKKKYKVVLRHENGTGSFAGTPFTLAREADIYRGLEDSGLPIPRLLAVSADKRTLLLEWVAGEVDRQGACLDEYLRILGQLHALPADQFCTAGVAKGEASELDCWYGIYQNRITVKSPLVELAVSILGDNRSSVPERFVLCHGDAGPGNYLCCHGRVTAVLDWELAHVGDPMDDLAWITVRALLSAIDLRDFGERVRINYVARTGFDLNHDRLRYWQAMTCLRMLIMCLVVLGDRSRRQGRLVQIMIVPVLERQLLALLADISDVRLADITNCRTPVELRYFPVSALQEICNQLSDTVLPAACGSDVEIEIRRMRALLSNMLDVKGIGMASIAVDECDRTFADLVRDSDGQLAWLPKSRAMAYRQLAGF